MGFQSRFASHSDTFVFKTHTHAHPAHTPEWTNFNQSDPSITLAEGGWLRDASLFLHNDRGPSSMDFDISPADHASAATALADASPSLSISWLFS